MLASVHPESSGTPSPHSADETEHPHQKMKVEVCIQFGHWRIQKTQAGPQSCFLHAEDSRI